MNNHPTTNHYRVIRYFTDFSAGDMQEVIAENLTLDAAEQMARAEARLPGEDVSIEDQYETGLASELPAELQPGGFEKQIQAIETFIHKTAHAYTTDYGDWMREANTYFLELSSALNGTPIAIQHKLAQMQDLIQFRPDWHALKTCRAVVNLALAMRRELGAPDDISLQSLNLSNNEIDHDDLTGLPRTDYSTSVTQPAENRQPEES